MKFINIIENDKKTGFFLLFIPFISFSQKQGNIWYFGDNAGLDFSAGNPQFIDGGQTHYVGCPDICHSEGTAVISDSIGNLLFYTDGETIWNKNHQIMLNGSDLFGNASSTQSSLILPLPNSQRYFYVFTTDDYYYSDLQHGFRYSIVDMCLDDGLGGIIENEKNKFILDTVCEKLTAIRHSNGVDYWVIVHKFDSDAFYVYLFTENGLSPPVVSSVGSPQGGWSDLGIGGSYLAMGQLKASPNGKKLALVNGGDFMPPAIAEFYDFNHSTGIVSNPVTILNQEEMVRYYGVSFSPDNSKLYFSTIQGAKAIYQYDLNAGDGHPDSIIASRTTIAEGYDFLGLQLANNGKIYVARTPEGNPHLGVINAPNQSGLSCDYIDNAVSLNGNDSGYGFPNFVDSYDYSNTIVDCRMNTTENENLLNFEIYPNPFNNELVIQVEGNKNLECSIFDCLGNKVLQKSFQNFISLNTSELAKGIYFYELKTNDKILSIGKLIKQ